VVLRFGIHAGQHAPWAHTTQQPDAGTAAAGTDFHHRAGGDRGREEPQRGTRGRRHRLRPAEVGGVGAGGEQRLVLYRVLSVVIVDDCPFRDALPSVSLANFAGPWNLKVTLAVTQ